MTFWFRIYFCLLSQVLDKMEYPVVASMCANCLLIVSFTLLAPLPFLPLQPSFPMMMACACLCGIGYAISNVGSFTRAQKAAQRVGFAADLDTYIMISGTVVSRFSGLNAHYGASSDHKFTILFSGLLFRPLYIKKTLKKSNFYCIDLYQNEGLLWNLE